MSFFHSIRASGLAALIFLVGCGGRSIGGFPLAGAVAPTSKASAHKPSGSYGDLLYVSTKKNIVVLTYPQLKTVATLPVYYAWTYLCSDPHNGNIFALDGGSGTITVYAHGGTTPIATLAVPSGYQVLGDCAVDPTTGNLAVPTDGPYQEEGAVVIFTGGQGIGTPYSGKKLRDYEDVAYDDSGNLFLSANIIGRRALLEMPAGKQDFTPFKFVGRFQYFDKMQWDGSHLVYDIAGPPTASLEQVQVKGRYVKIIGATTLDHSGGSGLFWIYDGSVITPFSGILKGFRRAVATWRYPQGGEPTSKRYGITRGEANNIWDLTISSASSK